MPPPIFHLKSSGRLTHPSSCLHSAAILELGDLHLHPENDPNSDLVMNAEVMDETLTPEVTMAIWQLWQDDAIRTCVSRSREFQLNDSAP